eukprot:5887665-Pyramimonas_sp.AAC.1
MGPPGGVSGAAPGALREPGRGLQRWSEEFARTSEGCYSHRFELPRLSSWGQGRRPGGVTSV